MYAASTKKNYVSKILCKMEEYQAMYKAGQLDQFRDQTLIPPGSKFDSDTRGKWFYHMARPEACKPYPLPDTAIRHGRSWCEF